MIRFTEPELLTEGIPNPKPRDFEAHLKKHGCIYVGKSHHSHGQKWMNPANGKSMVFSLGHKDHAVINGLVARGVCRTLGICEHHRCNCK